MSLFILRPNFRSSQAQSRGAGTDSSHTPLDYARDEREGKWA
jgi:hypothetical protein